MNEKEMKQQEQNSNVLMAGIFITVGVVLIVSNITGLNFANWWVLFMLIPLAAFVRNIYSDYQAHGRFTASSTSSIIAAMAILLAAATFLFEAITWGMIWPVGLIFAGVAMFLGSRS